MIPTVVFDDGGLDREMIDIIEITDDSLQIIEDGSDIRIPIRKELNRDNDGDSGEDWALLEL